MPIHPVGRVSRARVVLAAVVLPFALEAAVARAGTPAAPLRMFITSTSGDGDFGTDGSWAETEGTGLTGFAAADKICQVRAEAATPAPLATAGSPIFRAWVSIGDDDAFCHVLGLTGNRGDDCDSQVPVSLPGPYYRVDGVPFADDLEDVATLSILGMPTRTENGGSLGPSDSAWTGIQADGTAAAENCDGWGTSTNESFGIVGRSPYESAWHSYGITPCQGSARLYCLQEPGQSVARPAWPEPAALVFLTTDAHTGNLGGLTGADILCQDEAETYGLPGFASFRAWLSDGSFDAKDRLTVDGPWYRPDGVRFVASKTTLIVDKRLDSPITITADGAHLGPQNVWTGTFSSGIHTTTSDECSDWFSSDSGTIGAYGLAEATNNQWTILDTDPCDSSRRFYCFGNTIVIFWDSFETQDPSRWSSFDGFTP